MTAVGSDDRGAAASKVLYYKKDLSSSYFTSTHIRFYHLFFFALIMQSLLDYNCELYLVQCVFFLKAYVPGQMVQISYVTGEQKQSLTVKNA